jgi:RNA recognition motif-containing protein
MATYKGFKAALKQTTHLLNGQEVKVEPRLSGDDLILKNEDIANRRIYVNMIPYSLEIDSLQSIFERFGEVEVSYIDKKGCEEDWSKNYGFITFVSKREAEAALKMETVPFEFEGAWIELKVAPFKKKSKKLSLNNLSSWTEHYNKNFKKKEKGSQTSINLHIPKICKQQHRKRELQKSKKSLKSDAQKQNQHQLPKAKHLKQQQRGRNQLKKAYLLNQNTSSNVKLFPSFNSMNSMVIRPDPVDGHRKGVRSKVSIFSNSLLSRIEYRHQQQHHNLKLKKSDKAFRLF